MYVCICRGVRESDLVQLASGRELSADMLIELLDVDSPDCCGRCVDNADSLAELANAEAARQSNETAQLQAIGRE